MQVSYVYYKLPYPSLSRYSGNEASLFPRSPSPPPPPKRVEAAQDPLELEENYVIQNLTLDLPSNYDVVGK